MPPPIPTRQSGGSRLGAWWVAPLLAVLLLGCDYCRSGHYRITLRPGPIPTDAPGQSPASSLASEQLAATLAARGFTRLRDHFWTRDGADVTWEILGPEELRLVVGAFGARREVRASERVELELVRWLLTQPGLQLAPETPGISALDP